MRKTYKLFATFMAIIMLISILPSVNVYADTWVEEWLTTGGSLVSRGYYGDNITWELRSHGVLTMSGHGEMLDCYSQDNNALNNVFDKIYSVVINEGITTIGKGAFTSCSNLKNVYIPKTVKKIGEGAFANLNLGTIYFQSTLDEGMFWFDKGLESPIEGNNYGFLTANEWHFTGTRYTIADLRTYIMYAPDGRTLEVKVSDIEKYKNVGWYTEPPVLLYSAKGQSMYVNTSEVAAYADMGWYPEPLVTLYSQDGRSINVMASQVADYCRVGWYTEPFVTMYDIYGNSTKFLSSQVEAQKTVGWYIEPVVTLYSMDNRTIAVLQSEVDAYCKVGWFRTKDEAANEKALLDSLDRKTIELLNSFYPGMEVMKFCYMDTFLVGIVQCVQHGKVQVLWTDFYMWDGFWQTDLDVYRRFTDIRLGTTTWEDPEYIGPSLI